MKTIIVTLSLIILSLSSTIFYINYTIEKLPKLIMGFNTISLIISILILFFILVTNLIKLIDGDDH